MKATDEHVRAFTDAFNEQFTELQMRLITYHDKMLNVIDVREFDETHDVNFFIRLADASIIHKCKEFADELQAMQSVIDSVNDILDDDENKSPDDLR